MLDYDYDMLIQRESKVMTMFFFSKGIRVTS